MKDLLSSIIVIIMMMGCSSKPDVKNSEVSENYLGKHNRDFKVENGKLTPEALWALGRIGEVAVAPDNGAFAYIAAWYSVDENKGYRAIYLQKSESAEPVQLTNIETFNEYNPVWRPDGTKIGYLSNKSGSFQIWEMNPDGTSQTMISNEQSGITGFKYTPDSKKIVFLKEVRVTAGVQQLHSDLPKANAIIADDIMYRHWDSFVDGKFSHVFVADFDGTTISESIDIMQNEPWESPLRPMGGMEQIAISPDSKTIAYTSKKMVGRDYAFSTNSDVYLYDIASGKTTNVSDKMMGYDKNPVFSKNGKMLAWESMEHNGCESDVNRLAICNLETREISFMPGSDLNVSNLVWNKNDESIFFISDWHARDNIYCFDIANKSVKQITDETADYQWFDWFGDNFIAKRMSISKPSEIYTVSVADGKATEVSYLNKPILDQVAMGKVEERWINTTDNKKMLVWVIYPPNFDAAKKYPALLYCQGGPQSTVSQFWSFRWNFQIMAANDYIIVAPNRRGLPGFGKEWNDQISGDYGGQNMKDYLSAIDEISKEPFVDKNRLGAVGASYGGFSVLYLAGIHNKRFKAFIDHDGMFNFESMYLETEEKWFVNWDMGGAYWDKNNAVAQKSYSFSPHKMVDKWDTPILVVQGGKDYRVPESQGFAAFNVARMRNIPARLLYLPEENHWVLSPQNGVLWQRTFFEWLDKWLK